jgi:hypothetical protein
VAEQQVANPLPPPSNLAGGSPSESDMSDKKRGVGRPQSTDLMVCISLRFPAAEINRLRQMCQDRGTNPSRLAGELIGKWFKRETRKDA